MSDWLLALPPELKWLCWANLWCLRLEIFTKWAPTSSTSVRKNHFGWIWKKVLGPSLPENYAAKPIDWRIITSSNLSFHSRWYQSSASSMLNELTRDFQRSNAVRTNHSTTFAIIS